MFHQSLTKLADKNDRTKPDGRGEIPAAKCNAGKFAVRSNGLP